MKRLLITVVTPSYNQGEYLEQTIRSVLAQDYPFVEYMVIDGGSTDNSVEIIKKYADRLAYWISEKDEGQSDAIAKGFELSSGDVLCWLNSDDVFLPGALSRVAEYFSSNPLIEAVSGGAYYIDANGNPYLEGGCFAVYSLGHPASYDRFRFYGQDLVFQQAAFWRREAYKRVGGIDKSLDFIMDLDLFARLARDRPFGQMPRLLAGNRKHPECKTETIYDVALREVKEFSLHHGVSDYSQIVRQALFWRYRATSVIRKLYLFLLRKAGVVRLERIEY